MIRSSGLLLRYTRPHRVNLAVGGLLLLVAGTLTVAQPMVAKFFLDDLAGGRSVPRSLGQLAALLVAAAGLGALGIYVIERSAESIVLTARHSMVSRLLWLRLEAVDRTSPGDLITRVVADSTQLRSAATTNLVDLAIGAVQLVGMVALMAYLDVVLFTVVGAVIVVIGGAATLVLPRIRLATQQSQDAVGGMGALLERALGALRTIKASGTEEREVAAVHAAAEEAWRSGLSAARWRSVAGISTGLVVQVSFLVVLGVGGARVAAGSMTVSALIAFLLYLFYLSGPVTQLLDGLTGLQAGLAAVRRIHDVLDLPTEAVSGSPAVRPGAVRPGGSDLTVAFDNVVVRYRQNGPPQLDGLTFEVPAIGLTAIVGPSGAGKTTVFSLLERFYDPAAGQIRLGGLDLRDWPLPALRQMIGYVEQDAPVLSGTLGDNLRMAAPSVTAEELTDVIALTRLDALVARLPDGIDTPVGHRGTTLSGGERQRVAIARALLRRPRLLLLDEATSQLDAVNELALRDVIHEAAGRSGILMVAHRLSTVVDADRILVIDAGRLRACGTHTELMESDDFYRMLATTQLLSNDPSPSRSATGPCTPVG